MGAFFTNVLLQTGPDFDLEAVLDVIREGAAAAAQDEVRDGATSDRTVLVRPADSGGWLAVYDEATEAQDPATLGALGAWLSRALEVPAVTVLVHDSDAAEFGLYVGGGQRDRFTTGLEPAMTTTKKKKPAAAGDPARWAAVLAAGHTPAELRAAWDTRDLLAEQTVARVAALLGADPRRACTGYRYLASETPADAVALRFRARVRPAHEAPAEGPARFTLYAGGHGTARLAVGDTLRLGATVRSAGAASRGLSVVVFGEALERGLVAIDAVELVVGDPRKGGGFTTHTPTDGQSTSGGALRLVALPEQPIPPGLREDLAPPASAAEMMKAMEAGFAAQVHVNVVGRVLAVGTGGLGVGLSPLANAAAGGVATMHALEVTAPLARPLRGLSPDGVSAQSNLLRPLEGTRILLALVALDAPRAIGAALAREGIEALLAADPGGVAASTTVYRGGRERPRVGNGKSATLLRGKRLDALIEAMSTDPVVDVQVRSGPAFDPDTGPVAARWGATFGTYVLGGREDERAPVLILWVDTVLLGEAASAALEERLGALVARAMAAGGLQGVVLRSGWSTGMPDLTAYETACGVQGDFLTSRAWSTRWLRVPGNGRLWLGAALAARLDAPARAQLATIADVIAEPGGGLALRLRRREDAPAFEAALGAILPAQSDSMDAFRVWYAAPTA